MTCRLSPHVTGRLQISWDARFGQIPGRSDTERFFRTPRRKRLILLEKKMLKLVVAAISLLCFASSQARPAKGTPPFCKGLDCPEYVVKKNGSNYELRCYQSYKWASTVVTGYEYEKGVRMGFMRLFDYIEGENTEKKKIPMAAPVAVQIQPGQGPFCKNNFTVNFFVPFAYQAHPIPPTSPQVFISTFPALCAYVKVYPGFGSNTDAIQKQSAELAEALEKDDLGKDYVTDFLFYGGYDSPFQITNRHNEIWFIQQSKLY